MSQRYLSVEQRIAEALEEISYCAKEARALYEKMLEDRPVVLDKPDTYAAKGWCGQSQPHPAHGWSAYDNDIKYTLNKECWGHS